MTLSNDNEIPSETHCENLMQILFSLIQTATETGKKLYIAQISGKDSLQIIQEAQKDIINCCEQFCEAARSICKDSPPLHTITSSSKKCDQRNELVIQCEEFDENAFNSVSTTTIPNEAQNGKSYEENPSTAISSSFQTNSIPEIELEDELNSPLTTIVPDEAKNQTLIEDETTSPPTTAISDEVTNRTPLEETETNTIETKDDAATSSSTGPLKKFNCESCTLYI